MLGTAIAPRSTLVLSGVAPNSLDIFDLLIGPYVLGLN